MVIVDKTSGKNGELTNAFLKPSQPNKNSKTIVITIPKVFADELGITKNSNVVMSLDKINKLIKLKKVDL